MIDPVIVSGRICWLFYFFTKGFLKWCMCSFISNNDGLATKILTWQSQINELMIIIVQALQMFYRKTKKEQNNFNILWPNSAYFSVQLHGSLISYISNEITIHIHMYAYLSIKSMSSRSLGFMPHFVSIRRHTRFKLILVETYSLTFEIENHLNK